MPDSLRIRLTPPFFWLLKLALPPLPPLLEVPWPENESGLDGNADGFLPACPLAPVAFLPLSICLRYNG